MLQVTDPHLFADSRASLRGTVTYDSLQVVLQHIITADWPADHVAVTGDLIQDDSAGAYERFVESMSVLEQPIQCIPGNHDIRPLMQTALDRPGFSYCSAIRKGNWLLIGIDSCKDGTAGGEIAAQELHRLGLLLDNCDVEHVLIWLHHPPVAMHSNWLDSVGLHNASAFLQLISSCTAVRGAVFGHVHQQFDDYHEAIRIIGTPSTCRQFMPRSDEFAVDEQPPAYRRLSLKTDGTIDTELIWVNDGSAAGRSRTQS